MEKSANPLTTNFLESLDKQSKLQKFELSYNGTKNSLSSVKMHFSDGVVSPQLFTNCEKRIEKHYLDIDKTITTIEIVVDGPQPMYLHQIRLLSNSGKAELESKLGWKEHFGTTQK